MFFTYSPSILVNSKFPAPLLFRYCYRKRPQGSSTSSRLPLLFSPSCPTLLCWNIAAEYYILYRYPIFCIHSSAFLQLACFLVLASGTEIEGYPCLLNFRFALDFFLGIGLLGPKVLLCYFSNEPLYCSSCCMYLCALGRTVQEGSLVSTSSPHLSFVECLQWLF